MNVSFPFGLMRQGSTFNPVGGSVNAGYGLSGASSVSASSSAHWTAKATFYISNEDAFLAWQAFVANMDGVIGTTLVPCDTRFLPFDAQARRLSGCDAVALGNAVFWDGAGLAQTDVVHAELNSDAALRDGIIEMRKVDTLGVRPGHMIGLGANLHRVSTVHHKSEDVDVLGVKPLLRKSVMSGTRIILDRPVCRMRFSDPNQGQVEGLMSAGQSITVQFVEAI